MNVIRIINVLCMLLLVVIANAKNIPDKEPDRQQPYTKLWQLKTKGKNIAAGLPVMYSHKVKGKNVADSVHWLTDGKLITYFWNSNMGAATWTSLANGGVNLLIDLKAVKSIDKVVLRCLGGVDVRKSSWQFPNQFSVYISKNGVDFYRAAGYSKLNSGEKDQSNFLNAYYLEPKGYGYIYPFEFSINADARYIGINIDNSTLRSDELAVIASPESQKKVKDFNKAYSRVTEKFIMSGINVRPQFNKLVISSNMLTPNILCVTDLRQAVNKHKPMTLVMELPEGITLRKPANKNSRKVIRKGQPYTHIELPLATRHWAQSVDHLFFSVDKKIPVGSKAIFYAVCDGEKAIINEVPIEIIKIPEIKPALKRLHISLAWMRECDEISYPNFFKTWKRLGFQSVSCFPRQWENFPKKGNSYTKSFLAFLDNARKNGFSVIMNESPFANDMRRGYVAGDDMFSQIPDRPNRNICPSYRGDGYTKEINRVEANVKKIRPDFVYWDIEYWLPGVNDALSLKCLRCHKKQKASAKTMKEFLKTMGRETFRDLHMAVQRASSGTKIPVISSYNHYAERPVHHHLIDFNQIYPSYISQAQPSLYVDGNALLVHKIIRKNYQLLKKKVTLPWLTTGTGGKYDPYKLEQMILESLLNGSCGFTYFSYTDFDTPMFFYYHSKALAQIAPYEDIIVDGTIMTPVGSNAELTYSGVRLKNQILLLVGNYSHGNEMTKYTVPLQEIKEIKDLQTGKVIPVSNPLILKVPKGKIRLIYISGK
jgi:hypothetical protein